jgi:hypothetical protein
MIAPQAWLKDETAAFSARVQLSDNKAELVPTASPGNRLDYTNGCIHSGAGSPNARECVAVVQLTPRCIT